MAGGRPSYCWRETILWLEGGLGCCSPQPPATTMLVLRGSGVLSPLVSPEQEIYSCLSESSAFPKNFMFNLIATSNLLCI